MVVPPVDPLSVRTLPAEPAVVRLSRTARPAPPAPVTEEASRSSEVAGTAWVACEPPMEPPPGTAGPVNTWPRAPIRRRPFEVSTARTMMIAAGMSTAASEAPKIFRLHARANLMAAMVSVALPAANRFAESRAIFLAAADRAATMRPQREDLG